MRCFSIFRNTTIWLFHKYLSNKKLLRILPYQ